MLMNVAVRADRHRFVEVAMVPIGMGVSMLVLHFIVVMFMRMSFCQVQNQAQDHQERTADHPLASTAFTKSNGKQRANKRRKSKHRACSGRAE